MKKMSITEMITYSTVLIQCKYDNGTSGSGTGFLMDLCDNEEKHTCIPVLITNNHVVDKSTETIFEFCRATDNGEPIDSEVYSFKYEGNAWIHHPDKGVDLRCLPIGPLVNELENRGIKIFRIPIKTDLIPDENKLSGLSAMEDVVMVGYPIGLSDHYNHKPILRRGITASHPKKNYQGKKEILLDIAAYPGSSGSPVFIINEGSYTTPSGITFGNRVMLLGILYAGPMFNAKGILQFSNLPNIPRTVTNIPMNLGVMIRSERILEFENCFKATGV